MSRINKFAIGTVSRVELGNLSNIFKINIFGSLSEQIDTLKVQNKQNDANTALSIFYQKFRKKHALRECPLDLKSVEICVICAKNHETKECPSIPSLKVVYQEEAVPNQIEPLRFIAKIPWQNSQPNMTQGFNTQTFAQPS